MATMASSLEEATARLARLSCSTTTSLKRTRNSRKNRRVFTRIEDDTVLVFARNSQEQDNAGDTKLHLLGLPAELRDEIYKLVAADSLSWVNLRKKPQPALLGVSQQIRDELSAVLYHHDFFEITLFDYRVGSWVQVKDQSGVKAIVREENGIRVWREEAGWATWFDLYTMMEVMDMSEDDGFAGQEVFLSGIMQLVGTEDCCAVDRIPIAMLGGVK